MKLLAVIVLAGFLLGAPAAVACSDACSCVADAGSSAICIGGESAGEGVAAALARPVTLELRGGNSRRLSDELSRVTGKRIAFLPSGPDAINLDVKDAPLWDVLEVLSQGGRVRIEGEDFSKLRAARQALAGGDKILVCIKGAPVARVVRELSGLSGQALRVTSGDEKAVVTLSAKGITLEGILSRVSEQTGARIAAK